MANRLIQLLIIMLCLSCTPKSRKDREVRGNGLIEGNGGSGPSYRSNPWFLGNTPVSYCIRRGEISVEANDLKKIVADAIQSWVAVIDKLIDEGDKALLSAKGISFSKTFNFEETCREETDLIFAFGSADEHINQVIKYNSKNLVGFTSLVAYDIQKLRGRGEIYIAPDTGSSAYKAKDLKPGFWADHDKLFDVLLHEIGHVMGFEHDRTSFMFEYFPGYRVLSDRPGRLSAASLLARHLVTTKSFELCGKPWYSNGDKQFVNELATATTICFRNRLFDAGIIVTSSGATEKKFDLINIGGGGSSNTSRLFTETDEFIVATYADNQSWEGTLKMNTAPIPMTLALNTEGFTINMYDSKTQSWSEVVTLSDDLRLLNAVDPK